MKEFNSAVPLEQKSTAPGVHSRRLTKQEKTHIFLKRGIWLYYILLIFEGALRKWVLPGLATPLLVIRDPVAIVLIVVAINSGYLKTSVFLTSTLIIGAVGFITALLFGHGNVVVAVYGLRIFVVHFPLIFIIGRVFNREDVIKIGKFTLWLSIPMAILIVLQLHSPQSAWVNHSVNSDSIGAGFQGALGLYRPPGTFSFTIGNTLFFGFAGAYVLYFWFSLKEIKLALLICATIALITSLPVSISRTLIFQTGITILFALVILAKRPKYIKTVLLGGLGVVIVLAILSSLSFFSTASDALTTRFSTASKSEGGVEGTIVGRFLGLMSKAIGNAANHPFWGLGMGLGTSAGAKIATGNAGFQLGEIEWARLIAEMGILLGGGFIVVRVTLAIRLTSLSFKKLFKDSDPLPWMLVSFGFLQIVQGQWGQPAELGFGIIAGGLLAASLKSRRANRQKN